MRTISILMLAYTLGGCGVRTHEIDFSEVEGFDWNGKLRITEHEDGTLGPLLTVQTYWRVDHIELPSLDGRTATVDLDAYRGFPVTTVGVASGERSRLLGAAEVWRGSRGVVVVDPAILDRSLVRASTQPSDPESSPKSDFHFVSGDLRPYSQHIAELSFADSWAIAIQEAESVVVEFDLPEEGLRMIARGKRGAMGPSTLEIQDKDGKVLRRFTHEEVPARRIPQKEN